MEKITSLSNPRVQRVVQLRQKANKRREEQAFIVEGLRLFTDSDPERIEEAFATERFLGENPGLTGPFTVVTDEVMRRMSDTENPQGVLAVVRMPVVTEDELMRRSGRAPLFLLLEDIRDPGNLGTILRTAEAAGISGVFMSTGTADIFGPKAVRSTMSSIFRVPFVTGADLTGTAARLRAEGIKVYASYLDPEAAVYTEADFRGGAAVMVGNEARGLSAELADCADSRVYIPMQGQIESLNAAMAAGILMYEAARQRRGGKEW